jgi:hypothetical protein
LQDEETRELLNADFEIGQILRDRILPRAVLYFTGEAQDDEDVSLFFHFAVGIKINPSFFIF